jgi:hypothetical protein
MFHGFALIGYAVFGYATWSILKPAKRIDMLGFTFLVTLAPIIVAFSNIVVVERNQVMFVALFLSCYQAWRRNSRFGYALLALAFANLAIYYKEPTCLFVGGFAVVRLLSAIRSGPGFYDSLRMRWLDVALILSTVVFLLSYLYAMSPLLLWSPSAYHAADLDETKFLATVARWATKEPLLIPLMAAGFGLSIFRYLFTGRFNSLWLAVWVGSSLYFFSLCFAGLVSKYYAALPLFGLALHFYFELRESNIVRSREAIVGFLAIASVLLWGPALIYKYDWTQRNAELADELIKDLRGSKNVAVLVEDSTASESKLISWDYGTKMLSWDTAMLMIYLERIRKRDIAFYCDWDMTVDSMCPPNENIGSSPPLKLNLGSLYSERSAVLYQEGTEIWRYESAWSKWVPKSIRPFLATHYNFW